ncbi:alpha/beta hydrolase fold domain-containing protein [Nocardia sp. NPDC005825]|uniref:alpha/beta hydrolase fold domain-containing protein n=1 Tax=unclassified Nocardia TaxID=2637762 RepID=UPI00340A7D58
MRQMDIPLPTARAALGPVFRVMMYHRLPFTVQRVLMELVASARRLPRGSTIESIRLGGRPAERVTCGPASSTRTLLYLHGGGYTIGSARTHRALTALLAREIGCPVHVPDYRRAPAHPFPAALDDAEFAFLELVESGYRPESIAIAGDSAGGGLALALAQRLRSSYGLTPAALGLIAPWVNPNLVPDRDRDLVIGKAWSRDCAAAYLAGGDGANPGYAPLLGDMRGLPPTYVQVDSSELLRDQCRDLVARLRGSDVETRYTESSGLWHVAQLQAPLCAPAAALAAELAEFLRRAITTGQARSPR